MIVPDHSARYRERKGFLIPISDFTVNLCTEANMGEIRSLIPALVHFMYENILDQHYDL